MGPVGALSNVISDVRRCWVWHASAWGFSVRCLSPCKLFHRRRVGHACFHLRFAEALRAPKGAKRPPGRPGRRLGQGPASPAWRARPGPMRAFLDRDRIGVRDSMHIGRWAVLPSGFRLSRPGPSSIGVPGWANPATGNWSKAVMIAFSSVCKASAGPAWAGALAGRARQAGSVIRARSQGTRPGREDLNDR